MFAYFGNLYNTLAFHFQEESFHIHISTTFSPSKKKKKKPEKLNRRKLLPWESWRDI